MKKVPAPVDASPYKSVAEELETLRTTFRALCQRYGARVESEIERVRERVLAAGSVASDREKAAGARVSVAAKNQTARRRQAETLAQVHDLRDMLTLLRTLTVKPETARRKDLKKIEAMVDDLRLLVSGWA